MAHRTLAGPAHHEDLVMGSRFIAKVAPVRDLVAVGRLRAEARAEHPDAHHHCWAYRIGPEQRFSDDGEPGGTAGRPMLEVFLKRDIDRAAGVVVRYFGGRKLGVGGLARAYGGAMARAVRAAGEIFVPDRLRLRIEAPFAYADTVLRALAGTLRGEPSFDAHGFRVEVMLSAEERSQLERALTEATRGEAHLVVLDEDA